MKKQIKTCLAIPEDIRLLLALLTPSLLLTSACGPEILFHFQDSANPNALSLQGIGGNSHGTTHEGGSNKGTL